MCDTVYKHWNSVTMTLFAHLVLHIGLLFVLAVEKTASVLFFE